MKRSTKLLLAGGILAALAYGGTTKLLLDTAFNRQPPKALKLLHNSIRGSQKDKGFNTASVSAAQRLSERESETVTITADDGITLTGHFVKCTNPKRVVIAVHGWRSSYPKDFGMISDFLHACKCDVLYIDQRAQNGSDGDLIGMGILERRDCVSWANYISQRCDLPIYLYGISMGASSVLMAGELDLPSCVHGIIADSAFTSPKEQLRHILKNNLHMEYKLREKAADKLLERRIGLRSDSASTVGGLKAVTLPVLLIHGTKDTFVPIDMFYENLAAAKGNCRTLIVEGAGHCMGYYADPIAYEEALLDFFEMCD